MFSEFNLAYCVQLKCWLSECLLLSLSGLDLRSPCSTATRKAISLDLVNVLFQKARNQTVREINRVLDVN